MNQYLVDITCDLLAIDSPSGFCSKAIDFAQAEATRLGYWTAKNAKGNLFIYLDGASSEKTIGIAAHLDTLGLMVRSIDDDGLIAFTNIGGPIVPTLDGAYCRIYTRDKRIYTGTILSKSPAAHVFADASTRTRACEQMYLRLDEVVRSKADVLALGIGNGDYIAIDPKTTVTSSGFIKSRFLDDKQSVACLFAALKELKDKNITPAYNLVFLLSTYEEVGHGASSLPAEITELLSVDMGCIGEDLSCTEYDVSICAKDSSGPYDYEMTNKLISLAKAHHLPYTVDIYPYYSSDVSAALRGGNDIKGALIGPGVHASHGMERTHLSAAESTVSLLLAYLQAE